MPSKEVVLTDVAEGIWREEFRLAADDRPLDGSSSWSIQKRTLRGGRSDGLDVVEVDNGRLRFAVLPTRGMGLWRGHCDGIELGWHSPVEQPVHPAHVNLSEHNGLGWLAGFNEWMCRCGLAWLGPPGNDVVEDAVGNRSETPLTLHGRIANTPAHHVEVAVADEAAGELSVTGVVDESRVFGPCLRLQSTLSTTAGSQRLQIRDEITNVSAHPAEVELLYHTNFGPPLLEEGSQCVAPVRQLAPRDAQAARGIDHWPHYAAPTAGFQEEVFYLELAENEQGGTLVLLENAAGERGVSLRLNRRQLPWFILWKQTGAVEEAYVTGLEPATCLPNFKPFERQQGRLIELPPGGTYRTEVEMAVHTSREELTAVEEEIAALQGESPPKLNRYVAEPFAPPP